MCIVTPQVGIDVAKDELVVSINQGKAHAFPNVQTQIASMIRSFPKGAEVHLEASGGYERLVRQMLEEAGIKVLVHNALKAKRMAQAKGRKAKTDAVDAQGLSQWGALLPEGSVRCLERQKLADLSRAIHTLKQTAAEYKKRMDMPELDAQAVQVFQEIRADIQKRGQAAEKQLAKRLKEGAFADWYKWLLSVPSIGKVSAAILVCELPEDVVDRSSGQICSYAGLAPIDDSSGQRTGKANIGFGNARLKACLYMPALNAIKSYEWARQLYAKLRAKGKSHQTAIVAVMRRLLVRAHAVLKRGSSWQEEPLKA